MKFCKAIAIVIAGAIGSAPAFGADELVIAGHGPEVFSNEEGTGLLDLVVLEAFRRIGRPAVVTKMPIKRGEIQANSGNIDGQYSRTLNAVGNLPNLVVVPEPMWRDHYVAITRQPNMVRSWEDLEDLNVVFPRGWHVFLWRSRSFKSFIEVDTWTGSLLQMLDRGRVDAALINLSGYEFLVEKTGINNLYVNSPPLTKIDSYLFLHEKHRLLIPEWVEALASMKADGAFRDLCEPCAATFDPRPTAAK